MKKLSNVRSNNPQEAKTLLHAFVKMSANDTSLQELESLLKISNATYIQTSSIAQRCKQIQQDLSSFEYEQAMCKDECDDDSEEAVNAGRFVAASKDLFEQAKAELTHLFTLQKSSTLQKRSLLNFCARMYPHSNWMLVSKTYMNL